MAPPPGFSGSAGFINQAVSTTTTAETHTSTSSSSSLTEKTATPSASRSKTLTKSLTRPDPLIGAWTTSTISSSTSTALAAYTPYAFAQMIDNTPPNFFYQVTDEQLLSTPFDDICPSGNCIADCKNVSRVFQGVPDGLKVEAEMYGRLDADNKADVTLFGTCSNLQYASMVAATHENSTFGNYFSVASAQDIALITSKMTTCFATTCEETRNPALCANACSATSLMASSTAFDFSRGVPDCILRLCDSTCALPYVDPDVLGIGVLISYYVQVLLLILCATAFLISAGLQLWRNPTAEPTVKKALKSTLETFLRVQTFFGISIAVATFILKPAEIDPLNGYALILTSVMGFLPPVFTMMMLHSHGVRSRFSTSLVFISYLINSVTFFILVRNLSTRPNGRDFLDEAINNLFSTEACGGGSAISLCHQLTGTDPVGFLAGFYNANSFANIKTVPILWIWTTLVLLLLMTKQAVASVDQKRKKDVSDLPKATEKHDRISPLAAFLKALSGPICTFTTLVLATVVFCLALGYQYLMVEINDLMDVMDRKGWSFGQVVALLFWAPPLVDIFRSLYEENQRSKRQKYEKVGQL
ncbi:hypothetical protein CMUS01_15654 [Colletotrichum musicola]|uniref:Uncharacterized protein n=1 Tax=Colletotrichum musicola TaxID=2175873 RepID=A0A8H6IVE2_9PEZI|nr:hypothetical protein CMUS01_15654 [Colletotrichum musicola]